MSSLRLLKALVDETLQNFNSSKFTLAHRNNIPHISAPFPDLKLELQYHERGHFYFGERGHYYFGLTQMKNSDRRLKDIVEWLECNSVSDFRRRIAIRSHYPIIRPEKLDASNSKESETTRVAEW